MANIKQLIRPEQQIALSSCVGVLVDLTEDGVALVDYPKNTQGLIQAQSVIGSDRGDTLNNLPAKVLLIFENDDPMRPIITGFIHDKLFSHPISNKDEQTLVNDNQTEAMIDGKRLVFNAKEEILLKCGKSSILLRKDGKVVFKGENLLSRASGSNKIKGSSVNIN